MSDARSGEAELSAGARARGDPVDAWADGFLACAYLFAGKYDRYATIRDEYLKIARAETPPPHQLIARHKKDTP